VEVHEGVFNGRVSDDGRSAVSSHSRVVVSQLVMAAEEIEVFF